MSYDDIIGMFMAPPAEPIVMPTLPQTPARRLRDAVEPIATQGWWSRSAAEHVAALGLGFFDGYVWGRAASLGTPAASVVVATFGVFDPALLGAVYQHGVSIAARDDVLAAREAGATDSLAGVVTEPEADAIATPLLAALAQVDAMGRPLFNALRALPVPRTAAGRLWRAAELLREHRGDGHLAACVAAGLDAVTMNVLTELWLGYTVGEYSGTRGCGPDRLAEAVAGLEQRGWVGDGALTAAGLAARLDVESATDASQQQLVDLLGDGIDELIEHAADVSHRIEAVPAFPSDPRKRAAG